MCLITVVFVSSYSLLFASRGANVVVNDFNPAAAQKVVDEITKRELLPSIEVDAIEPGELTLRCE